MPDPIQKPELHLEKELARRTRRLSALYTILSSQQEIDDLDKMMNLVLDQILILLACQAGSIHLLDQEKRTLHLAAHQGMSAAALTDIRRISAEEKVVQEIISRNQPLILTNIRNEPRLAEIESTSGWEVFVGIPIYNGKNTYGVLTIYDNQSLQVTEEEVELLEIIAGQIGIAIENNLLRIQAERLAIMEERNRLARELHDSVTQSLYSLTLFAETALRMMEAGDLHETRRALDEIAESSQQSLKEMRLLVHKLRPSTYKDLGLVNSIEQRLRMVEGRSGMKHEFTADPKLKFLPEIESTLYAIIVEALNNTLKHARADQIQIVLRSDEKFITLEITDNGCGFNLEQAWQSGGLGLTSIQERVLGMQGDLQIDSTPGMGTTIRVQIPE